MRWSYWVNIKMDDTPVYFNIKLNIPEESELICQSSNTFVGPKLNSKLVRNKDLNIHPCGKHYLVWLLNCTSSSHQGVLKIFWSHCGGNLTSSIFILQSVDILHCFFIVLMLCSGRQAGTLCIYSPVHRSVRRPVHKGKKTPACFHGSNKTTEFKLAFDPVFLKRNIQ